MKCPNCGAEVRGNICEYCDSEMPGSVRRTLPRNLPADFRQAVRLLSGDLIRRYPNDFCAMLPDRNRFRTVSGKPVNPRLLTELRIPQGVEIFLIHDDTLFHTGKNGFAVTSSGLYVKEMMETPLSYTWEEFRSFQTFKCSPATVTGDGHAIAYFTGSGDNEKLVKYFRQLQEVPPGV